MKSENKRRDRKSIFMLATALALEVNNQPFGGLAHHIPAKRSLAVSSRAEEAMAPALLLQLHETELTQWTSLPLCRLDEAGEFISFLVERSNEAFYHFQRTMIISWT